MAIKKRTTTPEQEAAIEAFGAAAEAAEPAKVSPAATLAAPPAAPRTSARRVAKPVGEDYDQLAATYAYLGAIDLADLPDSFVVKHTGSKEDAMLIALIAAAEDRSKAKVIQMALLDGLRAWANRLEDN